MDFVDNPCLPGCLNGRGDFFRSARGTVTCSLVHPCAEACFKGFVLCSAQLHEGQLDHARSFLFLAFCRKAIEFIPAVCVSAMQSVRYQSQAQLGVKSNLELQI